MRSGTIIFSDLSLLPVIIRMPTSSRLITAITPTAMPTAMPGRSASFSKKPSGSSCSFLRKPVRVRVRVCVRVRVRGAAAPSTEAASCSAALRRAAR